MANKMILEVVPASAKAVIAKLERIRKISDERIPKIIATGAYRIRIDSQRRTPVWHGVLRASQYVDYKGRIDQPNDSVDSRARQLPLFPSPQSGMQGFEAFIGSAMDYAPEQEDIHSFLQSAFDKHQPKVVASINKLLKDLTK